ncbi:MAG: DciA family protein [Pseudomonadota bacterium]
MRQSSTKGFKHSASLLASRIRRASESRGFAISRVLTHWPEIAGEALAATTRPVKVSHSRNSFGATLTILTTGSHGPLVEMQKDQLRDRVNAVYGYNAISRIAITQTAPDGFAEGQAVFRPKPDVSDEPVPTSVDVEKARDLVMPVQDSGLKSALEKLGSHVNSRSRAEKLKVKK